MSLTRMEDSVADIQSAFNINIEDGTGTGVAGHDQRLKTPAEVAYAFVHERRINEPSHPLDGMYQVFKHADGQDRFDEMRAVLHDKTVLLPKPTSKGTYRLCPVAISDAGRTGDQKGLIRVTILDVDAQQDGNTGILIPDQKAMLDGAVQAGVRNLGQHNADRPNVQSEPGHLLMAFAGALRPDIGQGVRAGQHMVHSQDGSVRSTSNVIQTFSTIPRAVEGRPLFKDGIATGTFTYDTWPAGMELVYSGIGDQVETSDLPNAVQLVQGLGFLSLAEAGGVDDAKRLIGAL